MKVRIKNLCGYQLESKVGDIVEARPSAGSMELNVKVVEDNWTWIWLPLDAYEIASVEEDLDYFLKRKHKENHEEAIKAVAEKEFVVPEIEQLIIDGKATTIDNFHFRQKHHITPDASFKSDLHYDNTNGSLYKFASDHNLNAWEFDIIKRVVRCRNKGQFTEDLEKTKRVIDLYLKEYEK